MDERSKTLMVTGGVLLVILAVVFGTIFYLIQNFRGGKTGGDNRNVLSTTTTAPRTGGPTSPQPVIGETKSYQGASFTFNYPKGWGKLTCSNSQHLELDPLSGTDQLNVLCDRAVKPITLVVGGSDCAGEAVTLGNVQVVRQKKTTSTGADYKWCTNTQPKLEISHRVSSDGSPATSRDDFSSQIEEVIKSLRFGGSS